MITCRLFVLVVVAVVVTVAVDVVVTVVGAVAVVVDETVVGAVVEDQMWRLGLWEGDVTLKIPGEMRMLQRMRSGSSFICLLIYLPVAKAVLFTLDYVTVSDDDITFVDEHRDHEEEQSFGKHQQGR